MKRRFSWETPKWPQIYTPKGIHFHPHARRGGRTPLPYPPREIVRRMGVMIRGVYITCTDPPKPA